MFRGVLSVSREIVKDSKEVAVPIHSSKLVQFPRLRLGRRNDLCAPIAQAAAAPQASTTYSNWLGAEAPRKGAGDIDEQESNQEKIKVRTLRTVGCGTRLSKWAMVKIGPLGRESDG